jgi:hypothetical protein
MSLNGWKQKRQKYNEQLQRRVENSSLSMHKNTRCEEGYELRNVQEEAGK